MTTIVLTVAGSLQREIKQDKPFDSIQEEVFLNLQRTAEAIQFRLAEVLKTCDLTPTQYNVLRILRGAGAAGLPCREVSDRMVTRDPDVTRLLDRLERRSLVVRDRLTTDRRVVLARIAAGGLAMLEVADPVVKAFLREALSGLDKSVLATVNAALERLRDD